MAASGPEGGSLTSVAQPLVLDVANWTDTDEFLAASDAARALEQKGFCFIKGFADEKVRRLAEKEARAIKRAGYFRRVPEEATYALFGPTASCWTRGLTSPLEKAPESEENLRKVDQCLDDVGSAIARAGSTRFGEIIGRLPGVVHFSQMPEDRQAPKLIDPDEAAEYVSKASQKKVSLVYLVGPSAMMISLYPREDLSRVYTVMTKSPVILAYRNDVCVPDLDTKGVAITVEVDFVVRSWGGLQMGLQDRLPIPKILDDWFVDRLKAISDTESRLDDVPMQYVREAALTFHKSEPVKIVQLWHELPTLPFPSGGVAPFEASLFGGQDPVTEICKPRSKEEEIAGANVNMYAWGGKWDPDEYYDEDPMNASDFKMYTRHYSVLNRNHTFAGMNDKTFDFNASEVLTMDPRTRMLCEATWGVVVKANVELLDLKDQDIGVYVGLDGENQFWSFMRREAKIDKNTAQNMGNATIVNRLSYYLKCNGPSVCIDTEESSGLVALDTAAASLRKKKSTSLSFAGSIKWISNPFETILQCAAGSISKSGRTRVWDESADGFSKGEGTVMMMLELGSQNSSEAHVYRASMPCEAIVAGSGTNSKGASSSLAAPSATALQDVMARAAKNAQKPFEVIDAIEANAGGSYLSDAIELGSLNKMMKLNSSSPEAVPVRSAKATYGHLGPVSGLVGVARSCALLQQALHSPTLHLRQMMDLDGLPEEDQSVERLQFLTEVVEAHGFSQLIGVSSFGATGTSCHTILWGRKPQEKMLSRPAKAISWWPGGNQKVSQPPLVGYYIVGTWSAWEWPAKMEEESEGVFGFTLTMGENNWECFQIWLDEDSDRCLHPSYPRASADSPVEGPATMTEKFGKEMSWLISGESQEVRLINESQAERLRVAHDDAVLRGEDPPVQEPPCAVAYESDSLPAGFEEAKEVGDMPVVKVNPELQGKPGDRYRIRLHARGKYKRVEWYKLGHSSEELVDSEASQMQQAYEHKYHIIGDHNYWTFEAMTPAKDEDGTQVAEVQLLKERSCFQVYRDADWDQGFYPTIARAAADAAIQGPDGSGMGKNWQIVGSVGDRVRIEFRRQRAGDSEDRSVRWSHVSAGTVDFVELAKSHEYYIISSATDFQTVQLMRRSEDGSRFSHEISVGKSGVVQFQILLNRNFLAAVHPDRNDATMHGDGHSVEGPGDSGADKYWSIGLHPQDKFPSGSHVLVHMDLQGGLPTRVWWEKYESMQSHSDYLAWGCSNIFERHCRLFGFVPYHEDKNGVQTGLIPPAKLAQKVAAADFMRADGPILGRSALMPLT